MKLEPIATFDAMARAAVLSHPQATRDVSLRRVKRGDYWRARCATCGETAYASTAKKAGEELASSLCLAVEKGWNDRMYGNGLNAGGVS